MELIFSIVLIILSLFAILALSLHVMMWVLVIIPDIKKKIKQKNQPTMTREEAFKAMQEGHKITHSYFGSHEYYRMDGARIVAEDGVTHTMVFWSQEQNNWREDGWSIYEQSKNKDNG